MFLDLKIGSTFISKFKSINKIIYASSAAVYGNNLHRNSENSNLNPLSPYAISKIQNEKMAENFSRRSNIKFIGFRFLIFSKKKKKKWEKFKYSSVISKWINKLKKNRKIEIFGNGKALPEIFAM